MTGREDTWVADPGIGWRILLTATLPDPPARAELAARLDDLGAAEGWATRPPLTDADLPRLRARLVTDAPEPLLLGRHDRDLVVSAHHGALDGLGLLTVLERLGLGAVRSSARGVGERTTTGGVASTIARRLGEVALHPPARITPPLPPVPDAGDVLVEAELPGGVRTAPLVHAAARAVVRHEAERGREARHVAVAIGAVRDQPADRPLGDHSVLLRLRDVERLDAAGIAEAVRTAPVVTPPAPAPDRSWSPLVSRAAAAGMRLLAPRLGSTLLVSHLGEVSASGVERLVFHPVTAGGTGLSLGAVGHGGRTVLTLRGRASTWNDNGLEQLLEAVISLL